MNRRSFIGNLAGALAGFAVLPPATTYERIWRVQRPWITMVPFWMETKRVDVFYSEAALQIIRNSLSEHPVAWERFILGRWTEQTL